MTNLKQYYFFLFSLGLSLLLLQTAGCKKEYSFEGGDLIVQKDSILLPTVPVNNIPGCTTCSIADELLLGKWNFKTGNAFLCGSVTAAGMIAEKTAFTFFGPSACSNDTGLVMTIYLPVSLDRDRFNIPISKAAFYYYDNNSTRDILISLQTAPFSATIKSFIFDTGIATGTFSGTVFKANGDTTFVTEGNYKIKLR
jgi:hypothetical protein